MSKRNINTLDAHIVKIPKKKDIYRAAVELHSSNGTTAPYGSEVAWFAPTMDNVDEYRIVQPHLHPTKVARGREYQTTKNLKLLNLNNGELLNRLKKMNVNLSRSFSSSRNGVKRKSAINGNQLRNNLYSATQLRRIANNLGINGWTHGRMKRHSNDRMNRHNGTLTQGPEYLIFSPNKKINAKVKGSPSGNNVPIQQISVQPRNINHRNSKRSPSSRNLANRRAIRKGKAIRRFSLNDD